MNWLHYLAEANLYLTVFYLAYRLLLAKETYNQLNRIYLLFGCVVAFILPVLQVGALKPAEVVTNLSGYSTQMAYPIQATASVVSVAPTVAEVHLTWQDYLIYAYTAGCVILLLALLVKLGVLISMIWKAKHERMDKYTIIYLNDSDIAFSFFNYLFIGTDAAGAKTIIRHELVHISQKHSLDILFVELLKIINWFNPFIYLLQNSLKAIHEYIADEQTAAYENDTIGYAAFLVNNAYGAGGSSITHSFFNYSLLKKRIIMLNQKRSGNPARLKYLIAAPLCAGLLCVSTLAFSKDYGWIDLDPAKAAAITATPVSAYQTAPTNGKLTPPPPPMLTSDGYHSLSYYLYKNISYHPSKTQKDGKAIVTFTITADHKITNAKIAKSAGNELDAAVINAFNSFKLPVKDKPGQGAARIFFYTTDYSVFKDFTNPPNHKLDIMVDDKPHVYGTTKKGYEYQIFDWYDKNKATGNMEHHVDKVVIFEKNGEAKEFNTGVDDFRVLGKKYGFSWPNGAPTVKFPPPIVKPDKKVVLTAPGPVKPLAQVNTMSHDSAMVVYSQFLKDLADRIKYHTEDRKNNVQGRVYALFSVTNGNLQYLRIVRSISNAASDEVFNTIKSSPVLKKIPNGSWTVPVTFSLATLDDNGDVKDVSPASAAPKEKGIDYVYNPQNIAMPENDVKMLNDIVIRGYLKKS